MALGYAIVEELLPNLVDEYFLKPIKNFENPVDGLIHTFSNAQMEESLVELGCPMNNLAVEMAPVDEGFRSKLDNLYKNWVQKGN